MKKRLFVPIAGIALVGLMASFATPASAFPSKTTACTGCHSGVNVPITTTLVSTVGTTATYNVSAPAADAIVVFDGATKIFTFTANTGTFAVATGKTYTIYAVTGPSTGDGVGSKTISPVAAVVDATAPVTVSDALATYVSSAAIKLTATDAGTGVAATYYKLDGGVQTTGTAVSVSTLGAHTLEFWSTDKAGNIEAHKTANFTITAPVVLDTTAPVTVSDALATYVSSATIKLTASDAGSGVASTYYVLDGGLQVTGSSVTVTALGAHTLQFWSVDVAGNAELRKTAAFTITAPVVLDTTAPATVSDALATYVSSAAIKLTATDAGSGVAGTYYKLDGGAQVTGTAVSVSTLGAHTLEFWSTDKAGNIEAHKTVSFTITAPVVVDTTAPVTTSDAKATYVTSASVKLTATDAGTGVANTYYILDGGVQTAGVAVSVTTTGTHTLEFWSTDKAGNVEAHKTASFTVTDAVVVTPPGNGHTVKVKVPKVHTRGNLATLTSPTTGAAFTTTIGKRGIAIFKNVPAGSYKLTVKTKKGTKTIRTVIVRDPQVDTDDDHDDDDTATELNIPRD